MSIGKVIGLGSALLFVSGCQSWQYRGVEKLPPTAATPEISEPGKVQVRYWDDVAGTRVADLTSLAGYPDNPTEVSELTSLEGQSNRGDDYGTLVRGFIQAPTTGEYQFFVSGDDETQFWLSSSDSSDAAELVATVTGYTSAGDYSKYSSQASSLMPLTAGQRYYFEIRYKEGRYGDHFSVAWQGPGLSQQVISSQYLHSLGKSAYPGTEDSQATFSLGYRVGYIDGSENLAFNPQFPPLDEDQDGLYDNWEVVHGLNPSDPDDASSDLDGDFLSAADEFLYGTAENNADTDNDGIPDGVEFAYNLDPLDPSDASLDSDGDGFSNLDEFQANTGIGDPDDMPIAEAEPEYVAGFVGQYFEGTSFERFVLNRVGEEVDFNWGGSAPASGLPSEGFSVRWSGLFTPPHTSGTRSYTFTTRTDDGARLLLNGQVVIDGWRDQAATSYSYSASLPAGEAVPVSMEYYDSRYGAVAQLTITDSNSGEELSQASVIQAPDLTVPTDQDSDGDGIPDTWELSYGLSPWVNDASTVSNDSGVSNLDAYNSGLNPWTLAEVGEPQEPPISPEPEPEPEPTAPTSGPVVLSWTAPLTRSDGSTIALSEIDYYEIKYGQNESNLDQTQRVSGEVTSFTFDNLSSGIWYFSIRVVDDGGLSSADSRTVSKNVQ